MEKLLTPNRAKNVFSAQGARDFFAKGGVTYISNASLQSADAQKSFIENKLISNGAKDWSGEWTFDADGYEKIKAADKQMLSAKSISDGEKESVDPLWAKDIATKADKEFAASKDIHLSSHIMAAKARA